MIFLVILVILLEAKGEEVSLLQGPHDEHGPTKSSELKYFKLYQHRFRIWERKRVALWISEQHGELEDIYGISVRTELFMTWLDSIKYIYIIALYLNLFRRQLLRFYHETWADLSKDEDTKHKECARQNHFQYLMKFYISKVNIILVW